MAWSQKFLLEQIVVRKQAYEAHGADTLSASHLAPLIIFCVLFCFDVEPGRLQTRFKISQLTAQEPLVELMPVLGHLHAMATVKFQPFNATSEPPSRCCRRWTTRDLANILLTPLQS